jgi:hypothetical protein
MGSLPIMYNVRMTRTPKMPDLVRVPLVLSQTEIEQLDDWQFTYRHRTRTAALRAMMQLAYDAAPAAKSAHPEQPTHSAQPTQPTQPAQPAQRATHKPTEPEPSEGRRRTTPVEPAPVLPRKPRR